MEPVLEHVRGASGQQVFDFWVHFGVHFGRPDAFWCVFSRRFWSSVVLETAQKSYPHTQSWNLGLAGRS